MKTLNIIILSLIMAVTASAMEWHTTRINTFFWSPVEKSDETDVIVYLVYLKDFTTGVVTYYGETAETSIVVTFDEGEQTVLYGVCTKRILEDGTIRRSAISWSDNEDVAKLPFGTRLYNLPDQPKGLGIETKQ